MRAPGTMSTSGSSDPVSSTVAPYPPSTDYTCDDLRSAKLTPWLRPELCSFPSLQVARPDDPRRLVGERDGHQHARFASQHLFEPRTLWGAAFARLKHDGAAADDE